MKIPEHRVKRTLRQVKFGQTVYATVDVLRVDQNGDGWILVDDQQTGILEPPKNEPYLSYLRMKRVHGHDHRGAWEVMASIHTIYAASFGWGVTEIPDQVEPVVLYEEEIRH